MLYLKGFKYEIGLVINLFKRLDVFQCLHLQNGDKILFLLALILFLGQCLV